MVTVTRISATGRRRRTHDFHSPRLYRLADGRPLDTEPSSSYSTVHNPNTETPQKSHSESDNSDLNGRRRSSQPEMASDYYPRKDTLLRTTSTRNSEVNVREGRRKHDSSSRRRREKAKEEVDDNRIYVYRYIYDDPRVGSSKSVPRRRASAPRATSKYESDRMRITESDLSRRHTERKAPHSRDWDNSTSRNHPRSSLDATYSRPSILRSGSLRESRTLSTSRPPLARAQTTTRKPRQSSSSTPTTRIAEEPLERKPSSAKKNERSPGILGTIFGLPKPPDPAPEKLVECLTCLSDVPASKSAKLACKHRMCNSCLRRIFTLSISDPQHMPPKCCTQDHIPLKHVEKLFDLRFKKKWNLKYQEYTTKNRIYCPAKGCGEWIKPSHIYMDTSGGANTGRKYGKCSRCRTKVCTTCNGKWHTSRECPKDEATQRFAEIAKKEGWQRCFNCSATVELKEGCNHMTCRCRAEFCMICGLKWKTCDCPWFNYDVVENDRLNHANALLGRGHPPGAVPNPALGYQEELDRRREQERRDENLARRIQVLGLDGMDDHNFVFPPPPPPLPPHAMNQDFFRLANDFLSGAHNPADENVQINILTGLNHPPPPAPVNIRVPPHNTRDRPAAPQQPPLRVHSAASRQYNNWPTVRQSERVVPGRVFTDYATEAQRHQPGATSNNRDISTGSPNIAEVSNGNGIRRHGSRHSAMAGLTRGSGEGRVDEWRRHVGAD